MTYSQPITAMVDVAAATVVDDEVSRVAPRVKTASEYSPKIDDALGTEDQAAADAEEAPTAVVQGAGARSGKSGKSLKTGKQSLKSSASRKKMMSSSLKKSIEDRHNALVSDSDVRQLSPSHQSSRSMGSKRVDALPIIIGAALVEGKVDETSQQPMEREVTSVKIVRQHTCDASSTFDSAHANNSLADRLFLVFQTRRINGEPTFSPNVDVDMAEDYRASAKQPDDDESPAPPAQEQKVEVDETVGAGAGEGDETKGSVDESPMPVFGKPRQKKRAPAKGSQATVVAPTGDDEKMDDGQYELRLQYSHTRTFLSADLCLEFVFFRYSDGRRSSTRYCEAVLRCSNISSEG